ncbi:hypothetical protein LIER_17842 [Lithospermum erythrorhizon]|uniref:Retrovirus-related Pol polyprotein from transposon TNT 1-94 n=1 Tax=Lithospermum erythrorhizon TaxID=34254 RepID=A0AAV3QD53_LITER
MKNLEQYVRKVIKRFNMESAKSLSCPLGAQFKLSSKQYPVKKEDIEHMQKSFICLSSWQHHVCHDLYQTRSWICYSSAKQIFIQSREGALRTHQVDLEKCVALSTTEVEYIVIIEYCKDMLWIKKLFRKLKLKQDKFTVLYDSQSAIHLSRNLTFHSRSKHIEVRYHWIRNALEDKLLYLDKVHTSENTTDMMTKVLPKNKHEAIRLGRTWFRYLS